MDKSKPAINSETKVTDTSHQKRSTIPDLPILNFAEGSPSNLSAFMKRLSTYALKNWGALGLLVESGEYWEPPKLSFDDTGFSTENDPFGFILEDFKEQIKLRRRLIEEMKSNRVQMYATIWGQLSPESEDKIKQSISWVEAEVSKDPR